VSAFFADRRLIARAGLALLLANARFWPTIAPVVSVQLARWERRASQINDPALRALALEKLTEERFNSEVAATLATLAPRPHRKHAVEAIVAYEVMYDYLDGLTEQATGAPLRDGHELYQAFVDAITPHIEPKGDYYTYRQTDDSGYLHDLVSAVRGALVQLPAASATADTREHAAARCAEAQVRAHAVPRLGTSQLEDWAASETIGTPLRWREFLAGAASSVLSVHALIAAAADPRTTAEDADGIDNVYLSICALSTMLDSLVDHDRDQKAGETGYIRFYASDEMLADDLVRAARRAIHHARPLHHGAHHVMTLVGVASYYASAPTATTQFARPVMRRVRRELRPLITTTLTVLHAWRLAKRLRNALTTTGSRHARG
jgi:tetraprenyl-beta-curcumene synthase